MADVAQLGSTYLIANRLPVNAVQERLGHSRPDLVLIHYARLREKPRSFRPNCQLLAANWQPLMLPQRLIAVQSLRDVPTHP